MGADSFVQLDAPADVAPLQPPTIPNFVDGQFVYQGDLNSVGGHLDYLYYAAMGGFRTEKPLTVLRTLTPYVIASATATVLSWDTVDVNNDSAFTLATDAYTVNVQTAGVYRINATLGTASATYSACTIYILVNGTDVINNTVAYTQWNGNMCNCETTVQLAKTSSIQVAYMHNVGSSQSLTTNFGGCRLEVEWLSP